jgi:hypothetical protein
MINKRLITSVTVLHTIKSQALLKIYFSRPKFPTKKLNVIAGEVDTRKRGG